jgi:hypothetical protein
VVVSSVFLQLLSTLRQHRSSIVKCLGIRGYQSGAKSKKRAGRLAKGAMLDVKAD